MSGSYPSSSIRTGSRCTTLTKLPVAFSARQQCQSRSGPHRETGNPPLEHVSAAVHVDVEIDRLADAQVAQLRLLEIGVDPDFAERADRHQVLPDLHVVARIDVSARDDAVDLRDDVAVAKVEFSLGEIAPGGFEFRLRLFDGRRIRRQAARRCGRCRPAASRTARPSPLGTARRNGRRPVAPRFESDPPGPEGRRKSFHPDRAASRPRSPPLGFRRQAQGDADLVDFGQIPVTPPGPRQTPPAVGRTPPGDRALCDQFLWPE